MTEYRLERDGEGEPGTVYRPDGTKLKPNRSQEVANRSPSGFQWGYNGSDPHQLALGILLDHTDDVEFAQHHYHEFTVEVIRHIEADTDEIPVGLVDDWVEGREVTVPREGESQLRFLTNKTMDSWAVLVNARVADVLRTPDPTGEPSEGNR